MAEMKRCMAGKDRRSRKTINLIQTTLLHMLCGQRIDDVRIVELCSEADINRTTFYLHFRGVTDVLESLHDEILERIFTEKAVPFDFSLPFNTVYFLNACSGVLESYENLDRFLCESDDADYFLSGLKNGFCRKLSQLRSDLSQYKAESANYVIRFLASGMLDTYVQWLKTDRRTPLQSVFDSCAPIIEAGRELLDVQN